MEAYLLPLLNDGGPLGAGVVILVLVIGLWLRHKGWLFEPRKDAATGAQLVTLADRLTKVENDLRQLPTRAEIHALQLNHATMAERLAGMDRTALATASAVARIENFMIEASQRERNRK